MAVDFKLIEAHDVDIENFSYDIADMIDSIYIGPQGELLEKLETFNHDYQCQIGVTKNFTLKPGGYDKLKKAYATHVLRYDLKPRGIKSLFDRIQQYSWRLSNFKRDTLDIETKMKSLKAAGMRWQDNTSQFGEEFNNLKSSIISSLEEARSIYPNVEMSCKIVPVNEGRLSALRRRGYYGNRNGFPDMWGNNAVDFILMFYVKIKNADMIVHVMDEESIEGGSQYRMSMGDVYIASGTYLLPLISRHWGRTTPIEGNSTNNSNAYFLEALYLSPMGVSEHPYIGGSTDKYAWDLNTTCTGGNICTGNMDIDIRNSLLNNQILAHITNLVTWVTNYYVPQTHPLNRIKVMRKYGDDIKFVQWRNDLNNTSAGVFTVSQDSLPNECSFTGALYGDIYNHARNVGRNNHYAHPNTFGHDSVEYPLRLEEYLKRIDIKDMPCNNCSYKSDCKQWSTLQLIFQDHLTAEEEAYLGMLYEFFDFAENVLSDNTHNTFIIHYAEMAIHEAWRYNLFEDYFRMIWCYRISKYWASINSESFNPVSSRYRSRMNILWNKRDKDLKHLFEYEYLNDASTMVWTIDTVSGYRASTVPGETSESFSDAARALSDDNDLREWLESDEISSPPPPPEALTSEQRAIRWAMEHGGAQNL